MLLKQTHRKARAFRMHNGDIGQAICNRWRRSSTLTVQIAPVFCLKELLCTRGNDSGCGPPLFFTQSCKRLMTVATGLKSQKIVIEFFWYNLPTFKARHLARNRNAKWIGDGRIQG